jgi:hypothetical protein
LTVGDAGVAPTVHLAFWLSLSLAVVLSKLEERTAAPGVES